MSRTGNITEQPVCQNDIAAFIANGQKYTNGKFRSGPLGSGEYLAHSWLLFRRRHAVWMFLAWLIAMEITAFQNYVLSNGMEVIWAVSY